MPQVAFEEMILDLKSVEPFAIVYIIIVDSH